MSGGIASLFPPLNQFPDLHTLPPNCLPPNDSPFPTSANGCEPPARKQALTRA
jgi:hypothetical protein